MQEFEHRLAIWLDNADFVHAYNEEHTSHWVSLAQAAAKDLTIVSHPSCSSLVQKGLEKLLLPSRKAFIYLPTHVNMLLC